MTRGRVVAAIATALVACGGASGKPTVSAPVRTHPATAADRILPILPDGAQVVVELDLARLRENPVVGALVTRVLADPHAGPGATLWPGGVPGLPAVDAAASPLAAADALVLAAYGVGTSHAATVIVLATRADVPGATRLASDLVALGPADWVAQLEARAAIARVGVADDAPPTIAASAELLALRDRAMPAKAPGAALRITARLPFDARVALAHQTGLDSAPARLSIWADVVDDLAIIVDADAADPGDRKTRQPARRLEAGVRGFLAGLADTPALRTLGVSSSLARARLVARGTWVRAIVAIGPAHLRRVVERATEFLPPRGAS